MKLREFSIADKKLSIGGSASQAASYRTVENKFQKKKSGVDLRNSQVTRNLKTLMHKGTDDPYKNRNYGHVLPGSTLIGQGTSLSTSGGMLQEGVSANVQNKLSERMGDIRSGRMAENN